MGLFQFFFSRKKDKPAKLFVIGYSDLADRDDNVFPMFHFYAGSNRYTTISNHAVKFKSKREAWAKILQIKKTHYQQYFLIFEIY